MNSTDRNERSWSPSLIALNKSRCYNRISTVEELIADLSVVRALAVAAEGRRTLASVVMGAGVVLALLAAAAMPPSMVGNRAAPFVMLIPLCGVRLLVRRLIIPYELRRIDFASGVLQELDVGAQTQVALMLDLAQTISRRFKTSTEGQGGATRYVMNWLRLESVVASGDRFALKEPTQNKRAVCAADPRRTAAS